MNASDVHAQSAASQSKTNRGQQMKNTNESMGQEKKMLREVVKTPDKKASGSASKKDRAWIANAAITTINGTSMTVTKDGKTIAVTTTNETKLRRHYGGTATLTEFSVGNFVDVSGTWTDSTKTAIAATSLRNRSIMMRRGTFIGDVVSKTGNTIVIASKNRGNQTVTVTNTTKYISRTQTTLTLADVVVGHKIRVKGMWDKSNNTITQVSEVKDFTLPAKVSLTPTVTATLSATPTEKATESAEMME